MTTRCRRGEQRARLVVAGMPARWHGLIPCGVNSRFYKILVRLRLALRQNRLALSFVVGWLAVNGVVFARVLRLPAKDAALVALCIEKVPRGWPGVYQAFTEVVVFGVVASVVLTNVTRKYRPEETSRAIAGGASGHIVVIGWTNLGQRVWELARSAGRVAVVVEEDAQRLLPLVRDEEPVVVGSPRDRTVLEAASVARARVVVIATDDLESAAVACRIVRELNGRCEIVVRCADEDVGAVLARTYRARALSTSRLAASFIQAHAVKLRAKTAVVFGKNNVAERAAEALRDKQIAVVHIEPTASPVELASACAGHDLVVLCDDDLGDNLIRVDRIRDANKRARILCRAFHEDAAEVLTRAPFDCVVLSTSRHAADALARAGVFRDVGIEQPEVRPKRALSAA